MTDITFQELKSLREEVSELKSKATFKQSELDARIQAACDQYHATTIARSDRPRQRFIIVYDHVTTSLIEKVHNRSSQGYELYRVEPSLTMGGINKAIYLKKEDEVAADLAAIAEEITAAYNAEVAEAADLLKTKNATILHAKKLAADQAKLWKSI